jgi:CubicO group peptidase (beta-lactamase class C family)
MSLKIPQIASAIFLISIGSPAIASSAGPAVCGRAVAAVGSQLASTKAVVRLAEDWVDAINLADDATYVRFVKDRGPLLLDGPERWLALREQLRGIRLCGVKSADAAEVRLWVVDSRMDAYAVMYFKPAATDADKIQFVFMGATEETPPGVPSPQRLSTPALIKAVAARAASQTAEDGFSGAILLARNGRVLFQQAYGLADRAKRTPNRLDTQFRFGSMGKMFTAVAIMQLVQDGKIDLSAPIGRYLPEYPNQDIATKVTVAHLLSHSGGTGDIFGPEFDAHRTLLRTTKDYVDLYGTRAPEFAPGSRVSYSNYGFILLGRIVERASGLDYDAYIRRNIFTPLGMALTGNAPESSTLPHRAVGYMGAGRALKSADKTLPLNGTAAGGGYATVGDFNRFVDGLTSYRLLRRDTLQRLIEGGVTMDDGHFARFDFGGPMRGGGRFIGHGGGAPGMSGVLQHFVQSGFTLIVLANRDPGTAESIATFAAHRLPGD